MQNYKLEREGQKTALTASSPFRRWKSALDCSAIKEKKKIMSVCSPSLYEKFTRSVVICGLLGCAIFFHIMS